MRGRGYLPNLQNGRWVDNKERKDTRFFIYLLDLGERIMCVRFHHPHWDIFVCVDALLCGDGFNAGFYFVVMLLTCSDRTHNIAGGGGRFYCHYTPVYYVQLSN